MNIAQLLRASVERYPDHVALVFGYRRWTYSEWSDRIHRFAHALRGMGVRPGDRVAQFLWSSEFSVTSYFACQLLGAVCVPINHRLTASEAQFIIEDSGARVLVYGKAMREAACEIQASLTSTHDFVCCANDLKEVPEGHHHFETLAETDLDTGMLNYFAEANEISALVYTSGTTGRPKGVIHTHANDMAIAMNCVMEYGLCHNDIALHIAPLYHVGGMQAYFIPHMMVGGTNVILGRYEVSKTLNAIEQEHVTTLFAVPKQIIDMLQDPTRQSRDLSSLRLITTGGAAITAAAMAQVIEDLCPNIFNGYGLTEASLALILHPEDALDRLGSCGKPTLITDARIIERHEHAEPSTKVPQGEIGQLIVRGPQAMTGYWNRPFASAKKKKAGWVYTGDLFSQDDDGYYFFHGRVDDMIVSGGENIFPREVEEALAKCPDIHDVAVIGLPDAEWGEVVTACIERRSATLDAAAVKAFLSDERNLAPFKKPRRFVFLDALPRNPSGKVVRSELLALATEAAQ